MCSGHQGQRVTALPLTGAILLLQGLCANTVLQFLDLKVRGLPLGMPPEGREAMGCGQWPETPSVSTVGTQGFVCRFLVVS